MTSGPVAVRTPGSSTVAAHAHGPARAPARARPAASAPRPLRIQTNPAVFFSAACVGHYELFEARDEGEGREEAAHRHTAAEALCAVCPCLDPCAALFHALPATQRVGVWAGRRGGPPGPAP